MGIYIQLERLNCLASVLALLILGNGSQLGLNGKALMNGDPYFNRIGLELIQTPATSQAGLRGASSGHRPEIPQNAAWPLESAKSWVEEIVRAPYLPPENAPFVAFSMEQGVCDVVRVAYTSGQYAIEVAQSRYLISVKISGVPSAARGSEQKSAQRIAQQTLVDGEKLHFVRSGDFGTGGYGHQLSKAETATGRVWPHWFEEMRWWSKGSEVGFITIKAVGGPTREVIDTAEGLNKHWFSE